MILEEFSLQSDMDLVLLKWVSYFKKYARKRRNWIIKRVKKSNRNLPYKSKPNTCLSSVSIPGHSVSSLLHVCSHQCRMVQMDRGNQILLPGSHRRSHSSKCESSRHIHQYLHNTEEFIGLQQVV